MKALRRALQRPWVACLLISLLVLGAILAIRAEGWMQRPELIVYDRFVRLQADPCAVDPRIIIIGMTEEDLVEHGFPLDDARLARVLESINAQEPCVIGLDMYRDLPEPRSRELYPQLAEALQKMERIIAIERIGFQKPPEALAEYPDRIAANNLPFDGTIDSVYRRAPLFLEHREESRMSLSLALVVAYLTENGIDYDMIDGPPPQGAPNDPPTKLLKLGKVIFPRLTSDAGGYVDIEVKNYEYLLDFKGPQRFGPQPALFDSNTEVHATPRIYDFSFDDVIDGRIPPGELRGKIVLVATVMPSIKDSNSTPIDPNLRGVVQHALCVNQLLRAAVDGEAPPSWWPEWAEILWIAFWTMLGGALGLVFRSPWKLAPALAALLAALGYAGWYFFQNGVWILTAAPAVGCFVSATFVTSFIAFLERSERGHMQTLFSKHVSADVVEALWAERDQFLDGGRMKPQRVTATVLFTDLKGFSTTSEKMDPATLMNWMNEYMNGVARHVDSHDGIINKYIGDAIMALFGVPIAHTREEDIDRDARNAVECALAMRAEIQKLNADWTARGLPNTAMRVGIHTGPLVAGSMGSEQRLEFTVLGDTVNTAARLEGAGKDAAPDPRTTDCTILIGDSTFQRLHGEYETQRIGAMSLKGKAEKIIVHSVISRIEKPSPMKTTALTVLALLMSVPAFAQQPAATEAKPEGGTATRAKPKSLSYSTPKGSRGSRSDGDGGSRGGVDEKLPSLFVMAPKHTALTTQEQPALFWFQTGPAAAGFELIVTEPKKATPLISLRSSKNQEGGIHSVSLARLKKALEPNVNYQWSVALIPDPKNRSKDVVATGGIQRVPAPQDLATKIAGTKDEAERAVIYADAGFWYDALQSISIAIGEADRKKDTATARDLKSLRASLLDQGNLKEAAAADRK